MLPLNSPMTRKGQKALKIVSADLHQLAGAEEAAGRPRPREVVPLDGHRHGAGARWPAGLRDYRYGGPSGVPGPDGVERAVQAGPRRVATGLDQGVDEHLGRGPGFDAEAAGLGAGFI